VCFPFIAQAEKYKDEAPNALDLFKDCHYSQKKKGFTPAVQSAIVSKLSISSHPNGTFNCYRAITEPYNVHTTRMKWRVRLLNHLRMVVNQSL
jgi:hypothetical protein